MIPLRRGQHALEEWDRPDLFRMRLAQRVRAWQMLQLEGSGVQLPCHSAIPP